MGKGVELLAAGRVSEMIVARKLAVPAMPGFTVCCGKSRGKRKTQGTLQHG